MNAIMYKHIYFVIVATAPVYTHSHAPSIIKFNGLGVLDLDLTLLSEKSAALTSASSNENRSFYKN